MKGMSCQVIHNSFLEPPLLWIHTERTCLNIFWVAWNSQTNGHTNNFLAFFFNLPGLCTCNGTMHTQVTKTTSYKNNLLSVYHKPFLQHSMRRGSLHPCFTGVETELVKWTELRGKVHCPKSHVCVHSIMSNFVTPPTVTHQAPLSIGLSQHEY